jgi:signal transduction histidine kinase
MDSPPVVEPGPPWGYGRRGHPPRGLPIALAVLVCVVQLVGCTIANRYHPNVGRPLDHLGYALLVAGPVALVPRRRFRVPVMVVVTAITTVYYLLDYPVGPYFLAAVVALLGAVRTGHRTAALAVAAAGWLAYVVTGRLVHTLDGVPIRVTSISAAIALTAWIVFGWIIGEGVRVRSVRFAEIARTRAEQSRARAEQQRRQASEERLRIARELHDVLGHHLSLINVQAGVGLHLMDTRPEQARTSLLAIKQASAEALREVRSVLGVLRPEDEQAPRSPAPSLANLDELVATAGARLVVHGEATELPAEVDRAAYRIAQESLTNVRRHAGPAATATVTIRYTPQGLNLVIEDDGRGAPAEPDGADAGNGIAGMRARATALGGTLTAGNRPTGGYRVEAQLPKEGIR